MLLPWPYSQDDSLEGTILEQAEWLVSFRLTVGTTIVPAVAVRASCASNFVLVLPVILSRAHRRDSVRFENII